MKLFVVIVLLLCARPAIAAEGGAKAGTPNIAPALARAEDLLTVDNGSVKVGIDRAKGASIT